MMKISSDYERLYDASAPETGKIFEGIIARTNDYSAEDLVTLSALATCNITRHRLTHRQNRLWVSFAGRLVNEDTEWYDSTFTSPIMQETVKFHGEREFEQRDSFAKPDNFQTILGIGFVTRELGFAYITYMGHGLNSGFVAPGQVPRIGTTTMIDTSTIK